MGRVRIAMAVAVALAAGAANADEDADRIAEDVFGEEYLALADDGEEVASVVEGEDGDDEQSEAEVAGEDEAVRPDSRSPRGADRGGHAGQVSTLARAGLGPVFGALRSQGYGGMQIRESDGRIEVLATRSGERRTLVYDASDGTLLSDESQTASDGLAQRLFGSQKTRADTVAGGGRKAEFKSRGAASEGASRGGKSAGAKSTGRGGAKSSGGGRSSNGRGGGGGGKSEGKGGGKGGKNR